MKTSEFKRKIEAFGLKVTERSNVFDVHDEYGTRYASINRMNSESINLNTGRLYLIKLCLEYAETPIHEREDIKKYIVTLPDPDSGSTYVALRKINTADGYRVIIENDLLSCFKDYEDYHLTEAEIKRNHEYLWQFAEEVVE